MRPRPAKQGAREVFDLLDAAAFVRTGDAETVGVGRHGVSLHRTVVGHRRKRTGQ
jgi:hypothetical protein